MRSITINKKNGKYEINTNVKPSSFNPPTWVINAAYGSTDEAIPPAGTKVRCYSYGNFDDDKFYKDIVADGNQTLDDYFGWDLEYIGNIGDTFIIHQYAGMH